MTRLLVSLLIVSLAPPAFAQHPWDEHLGQVVTIDGLSWGKNDKGWGEQLTAPGMQGIYLRGNNLDSDRRLIRVTGVLQKYHQPDTTRDAYGRSAQGSAAFDYYAIDVIESKVVDKLVNELAPASGSWIVEGMTADEAIKTLTMRGYRQVQLPFAADKGDSKFFTISATETLSFRAVQGTVQGISRIDHRGYGRADDVFSPVKAYQLPFGDTGLQSRLQKVR